MLSDNKGGARSQSKYDTGTRLKHRISQWHAFTSQPRALAIMVLLLLCLAAFAAYSGSLQAPFYFDDVQQIEQREELRVEAFSAADFASAVRQGNRPVAGASLALNYLLNGYDVAGYRVVNIAIHSVTGFLLFVVFLKTLLLTCPAWSAQSRQFVAAAAALLWLVHPLHTQSVTYIVQRMNSLAALFFMLALLLYIVARQQQRTTARVLAFAGCAAAGLLALGSKQNAATLPIFILLYEWFYFRDANIIWLRQNLRWIALAAAAAAAMGFYYVDELGDGLLGALRASYHDYDFTLVERVLTEFRVVVHYFSLIIYPNPARLHLDYDFAVSRSLFDPLTTLYSLLAIAAAFGAACLLARRHRILSFALLWFLGNLVIESSIIGLDLVFEHRTYLPSMFLFLAAAIALRALPLRKVTFPAIVLALAALGIYWTQQRNFTWNDPVRFWSDNIAKAPGAIRPRVSLGTSLADRGRLDEAIAAYREALAIRPDYWIALYNLGIALADQGRHAEAVVAYLGAIKSAPRFPMAHFNLANSFLSLGRLGLAERHYRRTLELDHSHYGAHFNLALALTRAGKADQAVPFLEKAVSLKPDEHEGLFELARIYAQKGNTDKSIEFLERTLTVRADHSEARYNLANSLASLGRLEEAEQQYRRTIELDGDYYRAHFNFAVLLLRIGRTDEAIPLLQSAVALNPDLHQAWFNLGKIYRDKGQHGKAVEYLEQALKANAEYWPAIELLAQIEQEGGELTR